MMQKHEQHNKRFLSKWSNQIMEFRGYRHYKSMKTQSSYCNQLYQSLYTQNLFWQQKISQPCSVCYFLFKVQKTKP